MSYIDQSRRPSPASMAAVIGVHAAIAAALIAGLTVSGAVPEIVNKIGARNIPITPPPPPVPTPTQSNPKDTVPTVPQAPSTPLDINPAEPTFDTTLVEIPSFPTVTPGTGSEPTTLPPQPRFDPIGAKPRNNPAAWLTTDDYRNAWIRRNLTGLAKFRLEIAANGRVTSCTIVGSTGHSELDAATCKLVGTRARFEPARDGNGNAIASSYTSSVLWQLP